MRWRAAYRVAREILHEANRTGTERLVLVVERVENPKHLIHGEWRSEAIVLDESRLGTTRVKTSRLLALLRGATRMELLHNHPVGHELVSPSDRIATDLVRKIGARRGIPYGVGILVATYSNARGFGGRMRYLA